MVPYLVPHFYQSSKEGTIFIDSGVKSGLIFLTANVQRGIRKYTKTKVQFPDDLSAQKAVYLAILNIKKKWSMPVQNLI